MPREIYTKIIYLLLTICVAVLAQERTATYQTMSPNIFASYSQPIGIGILKFKGSNDLHKKLYDELKIIPGIHDRFTIFPYEVLEQQKEVLGISGELTPDNIKALGSLRVNLGISFVVCGNSEYQKSNEFFLIIYRTYDGQKVYEDLYLSSFNSTPLNDAVKLFSNYLVVKYVERSVRIKVDYAKKNPYQVKKLSDLSKKK